MLEKYEFVGMLGSPERQKNACSKRGRLEMFGQIYLLHFTRANREKQQDSA
jgi:hypothetical protein